MPEEGTNRALAFWRKDQTPEERGRLAVDAQKLICMLPAECYRRDYDLFNIRLYENNPVITLYQFAGQYYSLSSTGSLPPTEQSTNNKAKAAIDTLYAQVASTDQRARFLTVDGKYKQRKRARNLQNFADGLAQELRLHELRQRAFLDSSILESGVGAIQFYREGDRCCAQRALATEFAIDPMDGLIDGVPQTLYRRRPVPRDKVFDAWGKGKNAEDTERRERVIRAPQPVVTGGAPADCIEVFEAWHLQTSKEAEDGWHVISLDGPDGWLLVEPYTKNHHETWFFSLEDSTTGVWGNSLMHQMRPLQIRINANEYRVEKARKLCHSGHLYVDRAAKMSKAQFTNEIGTVWEGNGPQGPQQVLFQAVTAEWLQAIERDGQRIFENTGISQQASQGETNAGLNASAASKREDTQKSDKRNAVRQQRWERGHIDCLKIALGIVRDIVTTTEEGKERGERGGYKVSVPGKRGLSVVDWKDAALDEEQYVLQIKPASPIPTDPAGLIAFGQEMVQAGAWKPSQLAGYMQDLDADGRINRQAAQERQLEKTFEELLYEKTAAAMPDEFTNFEMALEIGTEYLAQGMEDEVPEKNLERVRRYLKRCKREMQKAQAANQPPQQAAPPAAAPPVDPSLGEAAAAAMPTAGPGLAAVP